MGEEKEGTVPSEAMALFVVTVNGRDARSEVVAGLDGVREAFLQAVWRGPRDMVPDELARLLESLDDAKAWAAHGRGDGRPFWHWWAGLGDGSVSVQRVTGPLPTAPDAAAELRQAAKDLAACAAELRRAGSRAESGHRSGRLGDISTVDEPDRRE